MKKTKPQKAWTPWRSKHLQKHYTELEMPNLVDLFAVSPAAIRRKALRLGVKKRTWTPWTPGEEQDLLRIGYPITYQIARLFNRSPGAVRDKLRELSSKKAAQQAAK